MSRRYTRVVGVLTTGRSDYGLLQPVIVALRRHVGVRVLVFVTGMHLSPRFGHTVRDVEADGRPADIVRVPALTAGDDAPAIARSIGRTTSRFARALATHRPNIFVVLGDRFEVLGAAAATVPFNIPLAHIHGGEVTEGAMDDVIRHALTKMSHLHFVATRAYAVRVRQMGEEPWRVTVSGAPGLDVLRGFRPTPASRLAARVGIPIDRTTLLVTYHPETRRGQAGTLADLDTLLAVLDRFEAPVLFTAPNADTGRDEMARRIAAFVAAAPARRALMANLGHQDYLSAMAHAGAMVGNSSSGLIEAPSFRMPVVNIGDRQRGRVRARNVIDVPARAAAIRHGIRTALDPAFRRSLRRLANPYGRGAAGPVIADVLVGTALDQRLLVKRFVDL